VVVSVAEKAHVMRQVRSGKASVNEPLLERRRRRGVIKTGVQSLVRWVCRKHDKRLRNRERPAMELLAGAAEGLVGCSRTGGSAHVLTAGR
jgi:hypothetical protein